MKYETLQQAVDALHSLEEMVAAYDHVLGVTYLDAATAAPKGSWEGRGRTMGILSKVTYELIANPDNRELLSLLEANQDSLDPQTRREVEVLRKQYDQLKRIPAEEYVAYRVLLNDAESVWEKAKNENDYPAFAPYLEKIVDYNRRFAAYYDPDKKPYDALLNEYEEGLDTQTLDSFFARLRETIVPLIEKVRNAPAIDDSFLFKTFPVGKQKIFSDYLMEVMGLDRQYCAIAESEHPFTTNFNNRDVRITTHYYENALASSMFSVIHEGGHALYELGCDDKYNFSLLSGGVSMGIHESQSRFYENIIGRSRAFVELIWPGICDIFSDELEGVTAEMFYRAVNKAEPGLIRTEADELTYCMHIMIRYEIEKMLIDGTLKTADVPAVWNRMYREYLGVDVPDDSRGCLQDTHWSGGMIGYFPSYALGSAYGAQLLDTMEKDLGPVDALVRSGELKQVTAWLKEHIHTHACFYKPGELFERTCGKFDPDLYTDYLTKKYAELYGL